MRKFIKLKQKQPRKLKQQIKKLSLPRKQYWKRRKKLNKKSIMMRKKQIRKLKTQMKMPMLKLRSLREKLPRISKNIRNKVMIN